MEADEAAKDAILYGDNNTTKGKRKASHRYSAAEDIILLKEVLMEQPFGKSTAGAWRRIHERSNFVDVKDGQAIQRRFLLLLDHFKKGNSASLKGYAKNIKQHASSHAKK